MHKKRSPHKYLSNTYYLEQPFYAYFLKMRYNSSSTFLIFTSKGYSGKDINRPGFEERIWIHDIKVYWNL